MLFSLTGFEAAAVTAQRHPRFDAHRARARRSSAPASPRHLSVRDACGAAAAAERDRGQAAARRSPTRSRRSSGRRRASFVAIIAAISAFGTCNALLLLAAEIGRTHRRRRRPAADLPPHQPAGAPVGALLVARGHRRAAGSRQLVARTSSRVYIFITLISTVSALSSTSVCAAAALKLQVTGRWPSSR